MSPEWSQNGAKFRMNFQLFLMDFGSPGVPPRTGSNESGFADTFLWGAPGGLQGEAIKQLADHRLADDRLADQLALQRYPRSLVAHKGPAD